MKRIVVVVVTASNGDSRVSSGYPVLVRQTQAGVSKRLEFLSVLYARCVKKLSQVEKSTMKVWSAWI